MKMVEAIDGIGSWSMMLSDMGFFEEWDRLGGDELGEKMMGREAWWDQGNEDRLAIFTQLIAETYGWADPV